MTMSKSIYDHFIVEMTKNVTAEGVTFIEKPSTKKNLEEDFEGLRYCQCEGIENVGRAKNVHTEVYTDASEVRTYVPDVIQNEATDITLKLYFVGDNITRQATKDLFDEYIRHGYHKYWDTARNKSFIFFFEDEIKVSKEMWHGSTPYIECSYKLKNINGKTTKV